MRGACGEALWIGMDKTKFFIGGGAMFSGVTCMLFPLSVIKTRQMVGGRGSHSSTFHLNLSCFGHFLWNTLGSGSSSVTKTAQVVMEIGRL